LNNGKKNGNYSSRKMEITVQEKWKLQFKKNGNYSSRKMEITVQEK